MAYDKGKQTNPRHKEQKSYTSSGSQAGSRKGDSSRTGGKSNVTGEGSKGKEYRQGDKISSGRYKGQSGVYAGKGATEKDNSRNYQENKTRGEKRDYGGDRARGGKREYGSERAKGDKREYGGERAKGDKREYGGERGRVEKREYGSEGARVEKREYSSERARGEKREYSSERARGEKREYSSERARGDKREYSSERARGNKREYGSEGAKEDKREYGSEKARGEKREYGSERAGKEKCGYSGVSGVRGERPGSTSKRDERQSSGKSDICPVAKRCGGCKCINKPYEEQLKLKEQWVKEQLAPFCKPDPIIGMKEPAHYRNKVHAVFGTDKQHNYISGIYEEGTHIIVPVEACHIEDQRADAIIQSIRKLLKSFKIRTYNEDTGYGLLRHVLIRTGYTTGQIMVVLVLGSPVMPSRNNFVKALLELHPEITTIVVNVNKRDTSMVLGDKEQVIYGKGYIEDELCGKTFQISPKSFYQVNPVQAGNLYNKALELAALTGGETVVDAYCGTGTIGIIASSQAGNVIGVERSGDAVKDARINAKRNKVTNIQFYQNDAGKFLEEMAEQQAQVDVVLMDPPRNGSDEAFLNSVALLKPARVVYISCNPETLARDLHYLTRRGYKVKKAVPVDMFPYTDVKHVETACLLVRKH